MSGPAYVPQTGPGRTVCRAGFLLAGPASLLDLLIWALRPGSGKPGPAKRAGRAREGQAGPGAPLCKSTRFPSNISHSAAEAPTESGARGRGSLLVVPTPRTTPGDSRGPRSSKPAPLTSGGFLLQYFQKDREQQQGPRLCLMSEDETAALAHEETS